MCWLLVSNCETKEEKRQHHRAASFKQQQRRLDAPAHFKLFIIVRCTCAGLFSLLSAWSDMSGGVHIWAPRLLCCSDPRSPERIHRPTPACQNTAQQESGTADGPSRGIGSDVAWVCVNIYTSPFPPKTKPQRDGCQLSQRLDGSWVGGMKGEGSKDGRERSGRNEYPGADSAFFFFFLWQSLNSWHFGLKRSHLF